MTFTKSEERDEWWDHSWTCGNCGRSFMLASYGDPPVLCPYADHKAFATQAGVMTDEWPACTVQGCGTDAFGPFHGPDCARSKFAAENLSLFWD